MSLRNVTPRTMTHKNNNNDPAHAQSIVPVASGKGKQFVASCVMRRSWWKTVFRGEQIAVFSSCVPDHLWVARPE